MTSIRNFTIVATACTAFLGAALPALADAVALAPRWKKNETVKYDITMESVRKSQVEGDKDTAATQRFVQEMRLIRTVIATDEAGGATLSLMYDRVKMHAFADKSIMTFDSNMPEADDEPNPFSPSLRRTVRRPITVQVDRGGKVLAIEGTDDPEIKEEHELKRAPLAQTLIGDDVLRKTLRPLYGLENAPATAKPGDTWTTSDVSVRPPVGSLTVDATHTLADAAAGVANVKTTGAVKLSPAVGNMSVNAQLVSHDIKASAAWDAALGQLKSYQSDQHVVISGDDPSGSKRTLDSTARITITRVEPGAKAEAAPVSAPSAPPVPPAAEKKK